MRIFASSVIAYTALAISVQAWGQELEWAPTDLADTTVHVRSLFVSGDGTVFAGTDIGLLRSDDGSSWRTVGPVGVNDFEELSAGVLVAVGREGVHRSDDGGLTWTQVRPKPQLDECNDFMQYTYVVQAPGGELLAGSIEEGGGSSGCKIEGLMYRSSDGRHWSSVPTYFYTSQSALPISQDTLIYSGDGGGISLYFNINSGGQISRKDMAVLGGASVRALVIDTNRIVYAATGQTVYPWGEGTGIHRSTDSGQTWKQINTGLTDTTVTDLIVYENGTLLASTLHGGVHRSTDHGDTWHAVNRGLPSLRVTAVAVTAEGIVYAGTDRGIYRSTSAISTDAEPAGNVPRHFALFQNYPNPFNPRTVIPFEIRSPSHVRLAIFDLLGREVAVLVDAYRPAGKHEVNFDASRLPSGVYQYRIETESGRQARSMVLFQ